MDIERTRLLHYHVGIVLIAYFNTCQNYVIQYVSFNVLNKDGSSYGNVGTFISLFEWISDAEAEKLKEQGY